MLIFELGRGYRPQVRPRQIPACFLSLTGVEHGKLVGLAEKHFGGLESTHETKDKIQGLAPPCRFTGSDVSSRKNWASSGDFLLCIWPDKPKI